jgi:hypothetical protein
MSLIDTSPQIKSQKVLKLIKAGYAINLLEAVDKERASMEGFATVSVNQDAEKTITVKRVGAHSAFSR